MLISRFSHRTITVALVLSVALRLSSVVSDSMYCG